MGAFRKFHGKELDLNNSCKSDSTKMNLCEPSKFELREYTQDMRSVMRSNWIFGVPRKVWIVTNLSKSLKLVSIPITVEVF